MYERDERIKAMICYLWIIGIIFYFTERKNSFVHYNAAQAIVLFAIIIVGWVVGWIPIIGWIPRVLCYLVGILLSLLCAINCWNGRTFRVPVIAEYADRLTQI